jgi:hypothetical protein
VDGTIVRTISNKLPSKTEFVDDFGDVDPEVKTIAYSHAYFPPSLQAQGAFADLAFGPRQSSERACTAYSGTAALVISWWRCSVRREDVLDFTA